MNTKNIKTIKERMEKKCSICGKKMKVILYDDRSYRGGHFFGKIPYSTKAEWKKALQAGTRTSKIDGMEIQVMKKDPKPQGYFEYWECSNCYWGKDKKVEKLIKLCYSGRIRMKE